MTSAKVNEPELPRFDLKDRMRMRLGFRIVTRQGDEYDFHHGLFAPKILPPPEEFQTGDTPLNHETSWNFGLEDKLVIFQRRPIDFGALDVSCQYLEALIRETLRHRKVTKSDYYQKGWREMRVEDVRLLFIMEKKHSPFLSEFADAAIFLLKDIGEPYEAINLTPSYWIYHKREDKFKFVKTETRVVTVLQDDRVISEEEKKRLQARPLITKRVDLTLIK
jgi:hypothetical protein